MPAQIAIKWIRKKLYDDRLSKLPNNFNGTTALNFYRIKPKYPSARSLLLLGQMPETRPPVDRCGRRQTRELLPLTLMSEEKLPSPSFLAHFQSYKLFLFDIDKLRLLRK